MKLNALYGLSGNPADAPFAEFKKDLFSSGNTPAMSIDTASANGLSITAAMTTGIRITAATTTGILLSSTAADGISITGVCTDGIHISSACTGNAIHLSGNSAVGTLYGGAFTQAAIYISSTASRGLSIGVKGKSSDGSLPITAVLPFDTEPANNYLLGVFSKVATTAVGATDDLCSAWLRTRVDVGMATNAAYSLSGAKLQLRIYAVGGSATTISNWAAAGVLGVLEVSGATTTFASGCVAAAGYFNVALTTTTVIASGAVVAGVVINTNSAAITNTGAAYYGLYIQDYVGGKVDFDAGVKIAASCCTVGIDIGACTKAIKFTGAITTAMDFDDATTCFAVITGAASDIAGQIVIEMANGNAGYINVYSTTGT